MASQASAAFMKEITGEQSLSTAAPSPYYNVHNVRVALLWLALTLCDNNRLVATSLAGVADRVMLGLIPSSEFAWPTALAVLKPTVR